MKLFPDQADVELYEEGFGGSDLLDRDQIGERLSELVERLDDPLVFALEGGWGTGKSHFLKRWVGAHTLENAGGAKTVYFDAFANDFISDPLPALINAVVRRLPETSSKKKKKLKNTAFKLLGPLARIGLAVGTAGANELTGPVVDALAHATSKEVEQSAEAFWAASEGRRSALAELRVTLTELTEDVKNEEAAGASLVVVIDELDRCRPDYALEVLEVIKHVFNVPRVHFILSLNPIAIQTSIKARYGAEIDAEAYLRKFIDLKLSLPASVGPKHGKQTTSKVFFQHLSKRYGASESAP